MKPIDQLKQLASQTDEARIKLAAIRASFKADAYAYHLRDLHQAEDDGRDSERLELLRYNCFNYIMNFSPYNLSTNPLTAEAEAQRFEVAKHIIKIIDGKD